ncbi:MAG: Wzz/FepE/Etk N-terminal domain-containing protein, partial [Nitrospirales bacterium]
MAQYELNLVDYWFIIRKQRYTIVLTAILVLVLTLVLTQLLQPDPQYRAVARVKFDQTSTVADLLLQSYTYSTGSDLITQTEVIRSFPVIEEVAQRLGMVQPNAPPSVKESASYLGTIYGLQGAIET